jgi:5-methylcytosine-specific restriction protein A
MAAIREDFERQLDLIFRDAEEKGLDSVEVKASDLHRAVGGYPSPDHRMPACCEAMRRAMAPTDVIVAAPPKGNGASLLIRYDIPRPDGLGIVKQ